MAGQSKPSPSTWTTKRTVWITVSISVFALLLLNWKNRSHERSSLAWGVFHYERSPCKADLSSWIEAEATLSWRKIFEQTGPPAGADVKEGFVIASPSKKDPDYFYTWTRDSAIVTATILKRLVQTQDTALESTLRLYAYSQKELQHVCNPSGCFDGDLQGLGEPKYNVNGTEFTGAWGRPQRDGPALRAVTLIGFANYLLGRGTEADYDFVKQYLYTPTLPTDSVIKADLEYIAKYWEWSGFDLWEEIDGHHFFTWAVSRAALEQGGALALKLGDDFAAKYYFEQASRIAAALQSFKAPVDGVVLGYQNPTQWNRTGLDAAVPLGVLIYGETGLNEWGPANPNVLATIKAYVDSFRDEYKINEGEKKKAVATGRYAEDVYDGIGVSLGNPWYLTTLSVSHVLSRALQYFITEPAAIQITNVSQPFWAQFDSTVVIGDEYAPGSKEWKNLVKLLAEWSEGFWEVVKKYQGANGQLDEQINRDTGKPQGARNLTWSYAAFFAASLDRNDACEAFRTSKLT